MCFTTTSITVCTISPLAGAGVLGAVGAGVGVGSATGATSTLGTGCSGALSTSDGSPSNGAVTLYTSP